MNEGEKGEKFTWGSLWSRSWAVNAERKRSMWRNPKPKGRSPWTITKRRCRSKGNRKTGWAQRGGRKDNPFTRHCQWQTQRVVAVACGCGCGYCFGKPFVIVSVIYLFIAIAYLWSTSIYLSIYPSFHFHVYLYYSVEIAKWSTFLHENSA